MMQSARDASRRHDDYTKVQVAMDVLKREDAASVYGQNAVQLARKVVENYLKEWKHDR